MKKEAVKTLQFWLNVLLETELTNDLHERQALLSAFNKVKKALKRKGVNPFFLFLQYNIKTHTL